MVSVFWVIIICMPEKKYKFSNVKGVIWPLVVSSVLSVALLTCRIIGGHTFRYWFLLWNLFLAWLPIVFALWLITVLNKNKWVSVKGLILTALWLGFLPNSFYLISDFIHLKTTGEVSLLFDAVLFMTFAWNGLLLGFASVMIIHLELIKRLHRMTASRLVGLVFILCSFAIYLGRYLSWNTWDIIVNPGGILFDLSDRIVKPTSYPNTFTITSLFSIVLTVLYYSVFKLVLAIRGTNSYGIED
jgi:uncharacterized membrane protein